VVELNTDKNEHIFDIMFSYATHRIFLQNDDFRITQSKSCLNRVRVNNYL